MTFAIVQAAATVWAASLTGPVGVTLSQSTGAGNTLVACVTANGNTTNPHVSAITLGGAAGSWQPAFTNSAAHFDAEIWYDPGCASGQTAVSVSCTGGAGTNPTIYVAVYEVAGVLTADKSSNASSGSATTWTSGATPTTTQASEIFFGACMGSPTAIPTVTGVGTWTTQGNSTTKFGQVSGYQTAASTGTATFSGTMTSGSYAAIAGTFYGPASGMLLAVFP